MKKLESTVEEAKASLFAAEGGLDLTIASISATLVRIAGDRTSVGVCAHLTQKAMEDGSQLVVAMVENRRLLLRYHDRLGRTAINVGAPHELVGPTEKPTEGDALPPAMATPETFGIAA